VGNYENPLDLRNYAEILGDPDQFFVSCYGFVPTVNEQATGEAKWIIDTHGRLRSIYEYRAGQVALDDLPLHIPQPYVYEFGPRPKTAGYENPLDLRNYVQIIGDPDDYFVSCHDVVPKIHEHSTGETKWIIDRHWRPRLIQELISGQIPGEDLPTSTRQPQVYQFGPRPKQGPSTSAMSSLPGKFELRGHVEPPTS
jgi:hypothetical protein